MHVYSNPADEIIGINPHFFLSEKPLIIYRLLISFVITLAALRTVSAAPYQLIESETATLNSKGSLEKKIDFVYETGYIPVYLGELRLRYGLFQRMEIGVFADYVYFRDQAEQRISDVGCAVKAHIWKNNDFYSFNLFGFASYKHFIGDRVIVDIDAEKDELDGDVFQIVSPYADEGRDISAGLLGRNSIKFYKKNIVYTSGITYTYMGGREYWAFKESQKNQLTFNFAPEFHFLEKSRMMIALENKVVWWINRGYYYSIIPQIRWEFMEFWVIEAGVGIPVIGEKNYRFIVGINQGMG